MNFINCKDSIFSQIKFYPRSDDLVDVKRYRKVQEPHFFYSDGIVFARFIVKLEGLIVMRHHSRFFSFIRQCSQLVEAADNINALYDMQTDIQTIQASSIHKECLTCEQLHLFLCGLLKSIAFDINSAIASSTQPQLHFSK